MQKINEDELLLLNLIAGEFYVVLPSFLKKFNLLAANVFCKVLNIYGVSSKIIMTRLWYSDLNQDKIAGCLNLDDKESWNGHFVCVVSNWLIDVSLIHLNTKFNVEVPDIILEKMNNPENDPKIISTKMLNNSSKLTWYRLSNFETELGRSSPILDELISQNTNVLLKHLEKIFKKKNINNFNIEGRN